MKRREYLSAMALAVFAGCSDSGESGEPNVEFSGETANEKCDTETGQTIEETPAVDIEEGCVVEEGNLPYRNNSTGDDE